MKKNLYVILLFCVNIVYAQDYAENKAFPKFLSSVSSSNIRTFVDDDGMETIITLVPSGQIQLNNTTVQILFPSLMIFRHSISDSLNFIYAYISDSSKSFSFGSFTDICKTKNGVGFMINFVASNISLKNITYTPPNKYTFNSVYLEFDPSLNLIRHIKFGSNGSYNISKFASDENENKYAFLNYTKDLMMNDSSFLYGTAGTKYGIFSFQNARVRWTRVFDSLNLKSAGPIQFLAKKNGVYLFSYLDGRNINFEGHLLSRLSRQTYILLKLDTLGNYLNEMETDSIGQLNVVNSSLLVSAEKVFVCMVYTTYLKFDNVVYAQKNNYFNSLLSEMDLSLNIKNKISFSFPLNGAIATLKAYDEDYKLAYFDLLKSNFVAFAMDPLVINDTIKYLVNFLNYPSYSQVHTLFAYSTEKKMLVSSYDYTTGYNYFSNVYCSKGMNPKVYCDIFLNSNVKLEGIVYFNAYTADFSYTLNKPSFLVGHPSDFLAKRKKKDLTELTWFANEMYDSLEVQKYSLFTNSIEYVLKIKNNPVVFNDTTPSTSNGNYLYKLRGYKNGEYSIWVGSDSTSTSAPLVLEKYIYGNIFDDSAIALNWGIDSTEANNIYYREIYRSENSLNGFQRIAGVPRNDQSYLDTTVSKNETYFYFVRDYNYMYDVTTDTIEVKLGTTFNVYGNNFEIFPNPCFDKLFLNLLDKSVKTITFIDACGRTLDLTLTEDKGKYFVDVSDLQSGIYTITYLQSGTNYTQRFVKM